MNILGDTNTNLKGGRGEGGRGTFKNQNLGSTPVLTLGAIRLMNTSVCLHPLVGESALLIETGCAMFRYTWVVNFCVIRPLEA